MRCRLAVALGKFLYQLDDMPSSEFSKWERYYAQEPFGAHRDNLHAAMIAQQLWLAMAGRKTEIDSFMFKPAKTDEEKRRLIGSALRGVAVKRKDPK